jgi:hypothetical protein
LGKAVQAVQSATNATNAPIASYWLWRFDRTNDLADATMLTDFWTKSISQAVVDLQAANDPTVGMPGGPSDVELAVDPYFPSTIPTVAPELKGRTMHGGGRNRLYLDYHAAYFRDARTPQ